MRVWENKMGGSKMRKKNVTIYFWKIIFAVIIVLYHTVYFKDYKGYVVL